MHDHVLVLDGFPGREAEVVADPNGKVLRDAWEEKRALARRRCQTGEETILCEDRSLCASKSCDP